MFFITFKKKNTQSEFLSRCLIIADIAWTSHCCFSFVWRKHKNIKKDFVLYIFLYFHILLPDPDDFTVFMLFCAILFHITVALDPVVV